MIEKKSAKETVIGLSIIAVLFFAGLLWISQPVQAEEEYRPLTPQAQTGYNSALQTLCEAEKTLASAKIMDVANGVKMDVDMNALIAKRDKSCDFQ